MPPDAVPPLPVTRATWTFDVSDVVPVAGRFEVAASWIAPADLAPNAPITLLVCLPGGFLCRRYFDLETGGDRTFSFAEAMAARGHAVIAFDHVGTGDSTPPEPEEAGLEIGLDAIAATNQAALEAARAQIAASSRADFGAMRSRGVGVPSSTASRTSCGLPDAVSAL